MPRQDNTDVNGSQFSENIKKKVWDKATPVHLSGLLRRDKCKNAMEWSEYGNRKSEYGWEIDHIKPVSKHGTDDPINLQALNWKNNVDKSDRYPWDCP